MKIAGKSERVEGRERKAKVDATEYSDTLHAHKHSENRSMCSGK